MIATSVISFESYFLKHETFVTAYKALYDDVAVFSVLPEQFIREADPVITRFIEGINGANPNTADKASLEIINGFIERFYAFTHSATAMFSEHQLMTEQTIVYLQDMMHAKRMEEAFEKNYLHLTEPLAELEITLAAMQLKVDYLKAELTQLKPIWVKIVSQLQDPV